MERLKTEWLVLGAVILCMVVALNATPLHAATVDQYGGSYGSWPSSWTTISSLNDPDDGVAEQMDFVGDATNPCAYVALDSNYLYVRARVDSATATFEDTLFVFIDKDLNNSPDYAFAWDSKGAVKTEHGLEFMVPDVLGTTWSGTRMNDIDGNSGQKISPPDFNKTGDGYIRTTDGVSTANFGTTTLIDFAVSWSYLAAHSTLVPGQTWGIQFGSIQNATDHNFISADVSGGTNPTTPGLDWSNPILMSNPPLEGSGGVPEPSAMAVVGTAIGLLGLIKRMRKAKQ